MPLTKISVDPKNQVEILTPESGDPRNPLLILAHGSGNDMNSPFLSTIAERISETGIQVVRFNFPYRVAGRQVPDRAEVLENSWRVVIGWVKENLPNGGLYIGGKSMGARVATVISGDITELRGLVMLGYPLHAPGRYDEIKDIYLGMTRLPMLFIQGTRDAFARMDLLQHSLSAIRDRVTLHWIEGGDHSFKVLVRQGKNYPGILRGVGDTIARWVLEVQARG